MKRVVYKDLPDGFFHENTYLTNPPFELKGQTKIDFTIYYAIPTNAIEPFNRIGKDTYSTY